jgi:sirohydrochlorin cobaltochelatase
MDHVGVPQGMGRELDARLKVLLPPEYQDRYEDVEPVSMGSAGLKYGVDGRVAWDEIWGSFCDLAMAGGPPHRGTLLEAAVPTEIAAEPERYRAVVEEICRGIRMVTELAAEPSPELGWVRVRCEVVGMAQWLLRAMVMENIAARGEGDVLLLPAGPQYRVEKEIKNVITAIAKTHHYYADHMWLGQQREIAKLVAEMEVVMPLVTVSTDAREAADHATVEQATGLACVARPYAGWLGIECGEVRKAVWMMRAMVASNVLARREGTVLYVPSRAHRTAPGTRVMATLAQVHQLMQARGL